MSNSEQANAVTNRSKVADYLGVVPLTVFFAVFYLVPLVLLMAVSVDPSNSVGAFDLSNYATFFSDAFTVGILLDTLQLGLEVTIVATIFAFPLALLYRNARPSLQSVLMLVILLPLLTSTVVRTFAWLVILGRDGVINTALTAFGLVTDPLRLLYTRGGLVIALAQIYLPLMALPIINSMIRIDDRLLQASEGLSASKWRTFWLIIVPLSAPGLLAGALLTFAGAATAFITQTLVGGGRQIFMPLLIYQQAIGLQRWSFAATLSILLMAAVLCILGLIDKLARSSMRGVDA
ncbi:MAG: ABC transporter permease [Hyphomicrobiaceae bacterium]